MAKTIAHLENEIRFSLLKEREEKAVTGGFRISLNEGNHLEVTELQS